MRHLGSPYGWAAVVAAGALAATGCGRADDQAAAGAVTEQFLRAVASGDGTAACEQLTAGAQDALEQDEGEPCAAATSELSEVTPSPVTRAQVFATSAKIDLADGHSAFLELTHTGWRVSAAGCRPEGTDEPYTCELEA